MARSLLLSVMCFVCLINHAIAQDAVVGLTAASNEISPQKMEINFTLANSSADPLNIYVSDLPWGARQSLMLVAVTNDLAARRLESDFYYEDPGPSALTLKPHDQLSGSIDLIERFPTLPKVLEDHEVIVFWSYKPRLSSGARLGQISGAVVLTKIGKMGSK